MKKLLLIGYRGYGDWIYAVPVLRYLFEEYEVHLETNFSGWEFFHDDPRFSEITVFDTNELYMEITKGQPLDEMKIVKERWKAVEKAVNPDRVINLFRSFESRCLAESYQDGFYGSAEERRELFGTKEVYQQVFDLCDISLPVNLDTTGLYYTKESLEWGRKWRNSHEGQFVVMVAVSGSGFQKKYHEMDKLVYEILNKYENSVVYLVGGAYDEADLKDDRIYNVLGNAPFKQVTLMTKYADLVIGPETGLHVAAGMWGTPKIQFCNIGGVKQICKHHENDYSIQSKAECSPCHKMVNSIFECDSATIQDYKLVPSCIVKYDYKEILNNIETVYEKKGFYVNA